MTISELQKLLEEFKGEYGDVEVRKSTMFSEDTEWIEGTYDSHRDDNTGEIICII